MYLIRILYQGVAAQTKANSERARGETPKQMNANDTTIELQPNISNSPQYACTTCMHSLSQEFNAQTELNSTGTHNTFTSCVHSVMQNSNIQIQQQQQKPMGVNTPIPSARNVYISPLLRLERAFYETRRASFTAEVYPQEQLNQLKIDLE